MARHRRRREHRLPPKHRCERLLRVESLEARMVLAGEFTDLGALGLTGVTDSSAAWGDYDNDGDLDILLTGFAGMGGIARVYQNTGGTFNDISAGLTGVSRGSVAWGDYDNDGDLDILLTGRDSGGIPVSRIYRNTAGTFSDISAGLTGVDFSSVAWGDYDSDGDLDILLTGRDSSDIPVSRIYRNTAGTFSDISAGLTGVRNSSVAWGDYDNDGDLDILLTGLDSGGIPVSQIYRNTAGTFSDISAGLTGVRYNSVAWGDYDNDGDLDILLTGSDSSDIPVSRIYRNTAGTFSDISAGLRGVKFSSVSWGDYDNDGDLDILLTGADDSVSDVARVYQNSSGTFSDLSAGLAPVFLSSAAWGDYDNDGDLDILLTGFDSSFNRVAGVYRNNTPTPNTPPAAPTDLTSTVNSATSVTFSWTAPTGDATPSAGLSYNLRVGSTPGGSDIVAPMAFQNPPGPQDDGLRKIAQRGLLQTTSYTVTGLAPGQPFYWSVQAIDATLSGGAFAAEIGNIPDFGDAPAPYPTTLAEDGARHAAQGPRLGIRRDGELDGVHSPMADADDLTGSDDEDGVIIPMVAVGGLPQFSVTIGGSAGDARLYGWIDFNSDGIFAASEQIADGTGIFADLADGTLSIGVAVPNDAITGDTFARFRVSTETGLGPGGAASDGEVEDYALEILAASPANNPNDRYDVDADTVVNFVDVLTVIADLRANGSYHVPASPVTPPFSDVDGNYVVEFLDILNIIAFLRGRIDGEGERAIESSSVVATMTESSGQELFAADTRQSAAAPTRFRVLLTNLSSSYERRPTELSAAAQFVELFAKEAILPPALDRIEKHLAAKYVGSRELAGDWRLESSLDELAEDISRVWANAAEVELLPRID